MSGGISAPRRAERENWQNLANAFVKDHPDVSIEITVLENEAFKAKLATAMQSGSPPDIFQSWGGGVLKQYADAGLVQDLTPSLQENNWGDSFQPGPLSLYTFDGKTYGVPWNAGMVGFWYNKALFKTGRHRRAAGNLDGFPGRCQEAQGRQYHPDRAGREGQMAGPFLLGLPGRRASAARMRSRRPIIAQGTFADQPFVDAGAKLKELVDLQPFQNGFLGAGYGDHQVMMANGKAAMELMGQWAPGADRGVATDVKAYNENLGWFPFPVVEGGKGDPSDALGGGDGFAIGKNAPKEAIDFVRFLTSVDNQTAMTKAGLAVPPTVKGAEAALDDPLLKEVQKRAGAGQVLPAVLRSVSAAGRRPGRQRRDAGAVRRHVLARGCRQDDRRGRGGRAQEVTAPASLDAHESREIMRARARAWRRCS